MFKRIFWFFLGGLAMLIGLFFLGGKFADVNYVGTRSEIINAPVAQVWKIVGNSKEFSNMESEDYSDEILNKKMPELHLWSQLPNIGSAISLEVINQSPLEFIEVKMNDNGLGMTGTWKYEFEPEGEQTKITITENSVTEGLFTRSLLNVLGRDANMDLHLKAIKKAAENI